MKRTPNHLGGHHANERLAARYDEVHGIKRPWRAVFLAFLIALVVGAWVGVVIQKAAYDAVNIDSIGQG